MNIADNVQQNLRGPTIADNANQNLRGQNIADNANQNLRGPSIADNVHQYLSGRNIADNVHQHFLIRSNIGDNVHEHLRRSNIGDTAQYKYQNKANVPIKYNQGHRVEENLLSNRMEQYQHQNLLKSLHPLGGHIDHMKKHKFIITGDVEREKMATIKISKPFTAFKEKELKKSSWPDEVNKNSDLYNSVQSSTTDSSSPRKPNIMNEFHNTKRKICKTTSPIPHKYQSLRHTLYWYLYEASVSIYGSDVHIMLSSGVWRRVWWGVRLILRVSPRRRAAGLREASKLETITMNGNFHFDPPLPSP